MSQLHNNRTPLQRALDNAKALAPAMLEAKLAQEAASREETRLRALREDDAFLDKVHNALVKAWGADKALPRGGWRCSSYHISASYQLDPDTKIIYESHSGQFTYSFRSRQTRCYYYSDFAIAYAADHP